MINFRAVRRVLIGFSATIALAGTSARAWGPVGHSEVGAVADALLESHPRAAAQVRLILGPVTLAQGGPWGDCIRSVTGPADGFRYQPLPQYRPPCVVFETPDMLASMIDYARNNWTNCSYRRNDGCHTQYHFADLALQRGQYHFGDVGTADYDIVHAIDAAVAALRSDECGGPRAATARPRTPAPFNFTCRQALLILTHLVGDLHQPLHVGGIYLDADGKQVDPDSSDAERAREKDTTTIGGNWLIWTSGDSTTNLHSAWDGGITALGYDQSCPGRNPSNPRPACVSLDRARQVPLTSGPIGNWPERWAAEGLERARGAFEGLSFGAKQGNRWPVIFADQSSYARRRQAVQRQQIEAGGARLAQLLRTIWPDRR
jgi:S1/P1 nuclease